MGRSKNLKMAWGAGDATRATGDVEGPPCTMAAAYEGFCYMIIETEQSSGQMEIKSQSYSILHLLDRKILLMSSLML